jgi:glyoxylase-like metal-dependent hydrolase (beta-lactamase superfamily II)
MRTYGMTRNPISYEFDVTPEPGTCAEVTEGIHWLRMPLPFTLGHINLWLLSDSGGWTIVDTGVGTDDCQDVWRRIFSDTMQGRAANRVIATHLHPDHVGCAGWLCDEFGVDLWMSRDEYLLCRLLVADTGKLAPEVGTNFYASAGFPPEAMERYRDMFGLFGKYVTPLPEAYQRLSDGDDLTIGDHRWKVIVGRGHSPEHACLFDAERNLLISGDQLLPTISSNVSVYPTEPKGNPLRDWLASLHKLKDELPADVLVLPAHGKPFRGAHARLDQLIDEHMTGLSKLSDYCSEPRRAVDVFPALFKSRISAKNLILATGESIAHLNYLCDTGDIVAENDNEDVIWYRQA